MSTDDCVPIHRWWSPVPFDFRLASQFPEQKFETLFYPHVPVISLPIQGHPGSFGYKRKNHNHEGVDLYVPEGTQVSAVEDGVVVAVLPFTGEHAGSPWWNDTWCVMVEGPSGVVNYGEIVAFPNIIVGMPVEARMPIGFVRQVLLKDKGRPMSMLHIELYRPGTREPVEWAPETPQPSSLIDPTGYLRMVR